MMEVEKQNRGENVKLQVKTNEVLKEIEEASRENEELLAKSEKEEKRMREVKEELKCWRVESEKVNVNFKEVIVQQLR